MTGAYWEGNPRRTSDRAKPTDPERYSADQIDALTAALKEQERILTAQETRLDKIRDDIREEYKKGMNILTDACELAASVLDDSPYPAQATLLRKRIDECKRRMTGMFPNPVRPR